MLDFVHPKVEFSHAGSFKSIVEGNRIAAVMIGKDYQAGNPLTIAFDYSNFPNCGILAARSSDITI